MIIKGGLILLMSCIVFTPLNGFSFRTQGNPEMLDRAEYFFERGNYKQALHHYGQAVTVLKHQKNWSKYLTAAAGKALTLIKLKEYNQSKQVLDSALALGIAAVGKTTEAAAVYYMYGVLLDLTNKPDASLNMHKRALMIRDSLLGAKHVQVSESYNGIGEVYRYTLRDYVEAEKHFKRAIDILEQMPGEYPKRRYKVYYNLATTNRLKKDYEKALAYAFSAIQTLESVKPLDTTALIQCYGTIANIYNNQRLEDKAIGYYRRAISLRMARHEVSSEMAIDFTNLSQAYLSTGRHLQALICIDSALMMKRNGSYDSATLADIYLAKGKALREAGRNAEAIQSYRQSLRIHRTYSRSNAVDISNVYKHLSEVMYKIERYDSALAYAQESLRASVRSEAQLSDYSNPPYVVVQKKPRLYDLLAHKGMVLAKLSKKDRSFEKLTIAQECFSLADRLMDIYWAAQDNESSKLHFVSENYHIYEKALDNLYELYDLTSDKKYQTLAFELMDKSKSRILRQGVEQARQRAREYIPDSLVSHELNLKAKITSLENRLNSTKDLEEEKDLNVDLLSAQKELVSWQTKIKNLFPQYAFDIKNLPVMTIVDLQQRLSDRVTFVEFFFGEENIYAFAAYDDRYVFSKIDNKNIPSDVYKFCGLLTKGLQSDDLPADFRDYTALGVSLYAKLLKPIVTALGVPSDDIPPQLLIVPDGPLCLVPFQALLASAPTTTGVNYRNLDYLVNHFTISYAFDAASPFAANHTSTADKTLLAFGWSDGQTDRYTAEDLPGTYRELQAIASIFPGEFRMGKEAAKKKFMSEASAYNILHLAIHGVGDERDIYNNYLQFRDDKLFAHELYGYNLNANLTVLSACETGLGKNFTAEGVYSIARGFFYAGSRSLLMTLWRINDGENVPLIQQFYQHVEAREYSSSALSKSQLEYLKHADEYTAHPRFWAGLVFWGNYKDISREGNSFMLYATIAGITLGTVLTWLFLTKRKRIRGIFPAHSS